MAERIALSCDQWIDVRERLKVKDKAFWTAVLAVFGFEVMMFNWIVVNFVITGLHSYA